MYIRTQHAHSYTFVTLKTKYFTLFHLNTLMIKCKLDIRVIMARMFLHVFDKLRYY